MQTSERPARVDAKALRAFLESEVGRETVRRELVEGTGVRAGQKALLLCDVQASDVGELEIQVIRSSG